MRIGKRFFSLFQKGYNVKLKEVPVDDKKYLGTKYNNPNIYSGISTKTFLSPVDMIFDDINRIISIKFEGDELYNSLELQIYQLDNNEYPLVIIYRKDNLLDVYYNNPKILESREDLFKASFTNISFNYSDFIDYKLNVDEFGLEGALYLKDKFDRVIILNIREIYSNRKLTSMLVPIATENLRPQFFPIIYLDKFGIVIKKNSKISLQIDGEGRISTELPIKVNGFPTYPVRYSLNPVICNWNNSHSGELPLFITDNDSSFTQGNITYCLHNNEGYIEIERIIGEDDRYNQVIFDFSPAIPNLLALKKNMKLNGRFSCSINKNKGVLAGEYLIITIDENELILEISPTRGWQPSPGKLWIKTYKWTSNIKIQGDKKIFTNSYWRRI